LAHFEEKWGKKYFEDVLLLARNIANPSKEDDAFPLFRHKDWFRGFSWASGVINPAYLNGKNQESSSKTIAAYAAVEVYGQVMVSNFWRPEDRTEQP
jgi:endo-1,3(4)-beta-glucanase